MPVGQSSRAATCSPHTCPGRIAVSSCLTPPPRLLPRWCYRHPVTPRHSRASRVSWQEAPGPFCALSAGAQGGSVSGSDTGFRPFGGGPAPNTSTLGIQIQCARLQGQKASSQGAHRLARTCGHTQARTSTLMSVCEGALWVVPTLTSQ